VTVRCPKCGTRYKTPARSRLTRDATFRCSRCRHVFDAEEERELPWIEEAPDADADEPVFTIAPARRETDEEDEDNDVEEDRRARAPSPRRNADTPPSVAHFAVRAALTVTLVYAIVAIYLHTHPERTRALLAAIPVVGSEIGEERLSPRQIELADVHGDWKRVHGDRLVFVITGTAINNAPVPVAGIQIEGRITGAEEHRQVVYVGAAPQDVAELGIREIELLQTLKPSSDWLLAPGAQDRFLVAFIDPPVPATEFAAEVVGVRGGAGRNEGPLAKRP